MKKYQNLPDEKLVEITIKSDKQAYGELVNRYEKKLIRYANYLIKNEAKAADAVQNTFIKGFVNLRSFNKDFKFSSWIYRICHNEAINEAKKYSKEVKGENLIWDLFKGKSEQEPEKVGEREMQAQEVRECIEKLPMKYKEPVALYYLEEMSYKEVADILRIPTSTVGVRINRGKVILKEILTEP